MMTEDARSQLYNHVSDEQNTCGRHSDKLLIERKGLNTVIN
jgi:hypothetical protein